MMTNAIILPLETDMELVITTDNSGAVGEKEADIVKSANRIVGKFACRVALTECLAEYAEPIAAIMQNFTNDTAWDDYEAGAREILVEAGYAELPITGSTESNFQSLQSGLGFTLVGKRKKQAAHRWTGKESFAIIGKPYVGNAVLENIELIPSVSLLTKFTATSGVQAVLPVGSKGIAKSFWQWTSWDVELEAAVDLEVTAGPATCFIIAFDQAYATEVKQLGGTLFHPLKWSNK